MDKRILQKAHKFCSLDSLCFNTFLGVCLLLVLFQSRITHAEEKDTPEGGAAFGQITGFTGDVSVNKKPVRLDMHVFHGDILITKAGKARIENHSSHFTVGPFTHIILGLPFNTNGRESYIDLIRGTLRTVIDKFLLEPFVVKTPTVAIGVRGTDFLVHATRGASVAFTKEGTVSFRADGKTVLMGKMEMTQGGKKIAPLKPETITAAATLASLLREVEQFCDLEIPPSISARKGLNDIIARWNLNYASYLVDKKAFGEARRLCSLAFFIADLKTLKAEAMLNKGMISFTFMGEETAALKDFEMIIEHYGNTPSAGQALYFKGLIYYHQRAVDKAKKTLEAYMKKYPDGKFRENVLSILNRLSGK